MKWHDCVAGNHTQVGFGLDCFEKVLKATNEQRGQVIDESHTDAADSSSFSPVAMSGRSS